MAHTVKRKMMQTCLIKPMHTFTYFFINMLSNASVFKNLDRIVFLPKPADSVNLRNLRQWTNFCWHLVQEIINILIKSKYFASSPVVELSCLDIQMKTGWFPKRYIVVQTGVKLGEGARWLQKSFWFCSTWKCVSYSWAERFILAEARLVWYSQLWARAQMNIAWAQTDSCDSTHESVPHSLAVQKR